MSASTRDVPAANSSIPVSVGATNVSVKVGLGDGDGDVTGTDMDGDAVPGCMDGLMNNTVPGCDVNDDSNDEDTEMKGSTCKEALIPLCDSDELPEDDGGTSSVGRVNSLSFQSFVLLIVSEKSSGGLFVRAASNAESRESTSASGGLCPLSYKNAREEACEAGTEAVVM